MPRVIRDTLLNVRELLVTAGPFILLTVALLAGAYYVLKPNPPRKVVMATGAEQGAYAGFGKRYQEELKKHGIQVELRSSAGARENLRMLRDPKFDVQVAFVQGGSSEAPRGEKGKENETETLPLISLGSMFFEPLWFFYRADAVKRSKVSTKTSRDGELTEVAQIQGWKVNVGARGSGTPGMVSRLLRANNMTREDIVRSQLDPTAAVVALLGGNVDAVALVSAPEAPLIQMLLQTPGIRLLEFPQAEAYARRYSFLRPVFLPRSVVDLARNVPVRDIPLIAATGALVAREDLHPALAQLFVQAAARIHGSGGWIAQANQFPNGLNTEHPLSREAERFYRNGPPFLQRYLPFWFANLVDRMWVALFSIIAVLIPLSRVVPPLYQFRIRSRIFRWYRVLRQIEDEMAHGKKLPAEILEQLDNLDSRVERVMVPLAYTDELYALRSAISLVRMRVQGMAPAPVTT
jgi:TRAP-type uncharacterized transport system substrate-binding protein